MGIKIFFKHLFNSIKKRPAQPIVLVLVISLATIVCVCTINVNGYMQENIATINYNTYGYSDFILSVNSASLTRFESTARVRRSLEGNECEVNGLFSLPFYYGEEKEFVYGVASELDGLEEMFPLELTAPVTLSKEQVRKTAIVSKEWADEHGKKIGDAVTVSLFDMDIEYTIFGLLEENFMENYQILVDTSSFTQFLPVSSFYLTIAEEDFSFSNQIFVKVNEENPDLNAWDLRLREIAPEMSVTQIELAQGSVLSAVQMIILMIMLSVLFVVLAIYSCCHILALQRVEETELFYCVGAKKYMLNLLSMGEIFLYWLIGTVIGSLFTTSIDGLMIRVSGLVYCRASFRWSSLLISAPVVLLSSEFGLMTYILSDRRQQIRRRKELKQRKTFKSSYVLIVLSIITTVLLTITACLPSKDKWYIGLVSLGFLCVTIFFVGKEGSNFFALFLLKKNRIKRVHIRYALKNTIQIKNFGNSVGLLAVFLSVIFMGSIVLTAYKGSMVFLEDLLACDYLVANVTEEGIASLEEAEGVDNVYRLLSDDVRMFGQDRVNLMGANNKDVFDESVCLSVLPQNDEVFLSGMLARKFGVEEGDDLTLTLGNTVMNLKCTKLLPINGIFAFIDAEYWGIPYNYVGVEGEENLYNAVTGALSSENAVVMSRKKLMSYFVDANMSYYYCGCFILTFVLIFSTVGICDNIISGFCSRKEEFDCYSEAGMNKSSLRKMKISEIHSLFLFGLIIFLVTGPFVLFSAHEAILGFAVNLFWAIATI